MFPSSPAKPRYNGVPAHFIFHLALAFALCTSLPLRADIYEWAYVNPSDPSQGRMQSGIVTPGGAGVSAVPSADLSNRNLTKGYFFGGNLTSVFFRSATLSNADLSNTNLTSATFSSATLNNATLSGATITGASFSSTTSKGFTKELLYSTASYQSGNLSGVGFYFNDLSGWDFAAQNLTSADFEWATLSNATLSNANLTSANFESARLNNANLSNVNLTSAYLYSATLSNATLSGATITGANFGLTQSKGFTKELLYSTASYQSGNLSGVVFSSNNLSGWNFAAKNLASASFYASTLSNATLSNANLTSADLSSTTLSNATLSGATITGANFTGTTSNGFTKAQLYSTASYQSGNLSGIGFSLNDMTGWNLAVKNFTSASFYWATLNNANLTNANLASADFALAVLGNTDLRRADARGALNMDYSYTTLRQNFIRPDGIVVGLALASGETMRIWDYNAATGLNIRVQNGFSMSGNSTLRMLFEDGRWGSLMQMEGLISVSLGGTLELGLAHGATPFSIGGMGTTFRLFDWSGASSVSGQFSQILLTGDYQGYSWDTSQLYTLGTITLVPEPGTLSLAGLATLVLAGGWIRGRRRKF